MRSLVVEHPALPSLEDLRFHIEALIRETGLTNKALAAACNQHHDPNRATSSPRVTEDTVRRIRKEERGHNVRYSTVAHLYNVLLSQARPVPRSDPIQELMIPRFRFIRPTDDAREVAAFMGAQQYTVAPYEYKQAGKRQWDRIVSLDKLTQFLLERDHDPSMADVMDDVDVGPPLLQPADLAISDFMQQAPDKWEICLVQDRPRNVVGLLTPFDLHRVA